MRWLVAALALSVACGDDGSATDAGTGTIDATIAIDAPAVADAGPSCGVTWELVETPVTGLELLDPAALNAGRPVRILVTTELGGCDDPAPVAVSFTFETTDALITPRAWRPLGTDCTAGSRTVHRPVTLELHAGQWGVMAAASGSTASPLSITVGPEPDSPCTGGGGACTRDCDCAAGERCLGGTGLIGPFTACARPCELDRDCNGDGACVSADDGLDFYCEPGLDECDGSRPCPVGYTCTAGACEPEFDLNQGTRVTCACDADCTPGLRCVEPLPGGERRCEQACRTPGPWCTGAHVCGPAGQDLSGLAGQNSVCIWLGE